MPPNCEPIVATGRCSSALAAAAAATAISMPGQCGRSFLSATMTTIVASDSAIAAGVSVGKYFQSTGSFCSSSPGSASASRNPSRSFTWLAKMMTAMPAVKPTVTGYGMNLM